MHKKAMEMAKCAIDDACTKGYDNMTSQDWDDFKDCMEVAEKAIKADYYYHVVEAMEEADEEEKEEIKYIMKKMKEEGEDWDEDEARRFYRGQPRSRTSGRFMSRGDGRRSNRGRSRGYEEPMYYGMMPEIYNPMEYYRDLDREQGRMYYSGGGQSSGGNSGGQSGQSSGGSSSGGMSGNAGGSSGNSARGYSDGYSDGYREGERNSKSSQSRYDRAKRGYEEVKQAHKSNTPEDKQLTMKETEKMLNVVFDEIDEMLEDASPEVKSLVKTKGMARFQKIQ